MRKWEKNNLKQRATTAEFKMKRTCTGISANLAELALTSFHVYEPSPVSSEIGAVECPAANPPIQWGISDWGLTGSGYTARLRITSAAQYPRVNLDTATPQQALGTD